jgi:hypothetical protein
MSHRKKASRFFLLFLLSAAAIKGQTSLTVSPLHADLEASAGKTKKGTFTVGNDSARAMKVLAQAEDWTFKEDGQIVLAGAADQYQFSCKNWIRLDSRDFILKPGERRLVSWTMTVPPDTSPGHYWTALSFEAAEEAGADERDSLMIRGKIMASVFVLVGKAPAQGEITDVTLADRDRRTTAIIHFKNSGRSYFTTSGSLKIKDALGKKIFETDLPEEIVLPGIGKDLEIELEERLPSGTYTVNCVVKLPSKKKLEIQKNIVLEEKKKSLCEIS